MATIKSYTDIEQSKKLAKILPLESADMCYPKDAFEYHYAKEPVCHYSGIGLAHPCWSLAALLEILPKPDLVQNSEGTWLIRSWINAYPWSVGGYSNPVDACVAMVEKLNELNLL